MNLEDIVLISDPRVLQISIKENNEPLINLSDYSEIFLDPDINKENSFLKARKSVVEKLLQAQENLPKGIHIMIHEAYRPLFLQKKYFEEYQKELIQIHPEWDEEKLYFETTKFVAPPDIIPPHSTGGAIDLTLCDSKGNKLDMGTGLNVDPRESEDKCYTFEEGISETSKINRSILIKAMTEEGFVNYPTEWWHWSYGDRYWAYKKGKEEAIFGGLDR